MANGDEVVTVNAGTATPYMPPSVIVQALATIFAGLTSPTFQGIVLVPTPTVDGAAANKAYVDNATATTGQYRDLGLGNTFPTTGPGGTPLQYGDKYSYHT